MLRRALTNPGPCRGFLGGVPSRRYRPPQALKVAISNAAFSGTAPPGVRPEKGFLKEPTSDVEFFYTWAAARPSR